MKEATGEVSGVVVTIVIIAAVLGIGTWLFNSQGVRTWIQDTFNSIVGDDAPQLDIED